MAVKIIQEQNAQVFQDIINDFEKYNKVFATQTHITNMNGVVVYTAVIFYKTNISAK